MAKNAGFVLLGVGMLLTAGAALAAGRRPLTVDDFDRLQEVASPACSTDGEWVAYTVTSVDRDADETRSAVWIVNWAGTQRWAMTTTTEQASAPQFSPDGRYVSFLGTRGSDAKAQLYLLDRRGGEPRQLTHLAGDIGDYAWSPDGTRIVLSVTPSDGAIEEPAHREGSAAKAPKPIVIGAFHFKEDKVGYVTSQDRPRLMLLDVESHALSALTTQSPYAQTHPAWSPDGAHIAYIGHESADDERTGLADLYAVDARAGAAPRRLAEFYLPNYANVLYTADGRQVAYTIGLEPRLSAYIHDRLALADVATGTVSIPTQALDRAIAAPVGGTVPGTMRVLVEDDRVQYPAQLQLSTGHVERSSNGAFSATEQCTGASHVAVVASTDTSPGELYAVEAGKLRRLSGHNDALMAEIALGDASDVEFPSRDGTKIHGILVKPVDYQAGRRYPTILWVHGGPVGQDQHELSLDRRQWFAAHGYAVLSVNYRGGSGRGAKFQRSIQADWGHLEVEDLLAGADYVVRAGIADPGRLGIGGWSYGGILTDYTIASDTRFRAAISGAGSGNQLSMFGSDQYAMQYVHELGEPWKTPDAWVRLSYPFFHADRIKTPTLFMGGDKDFNVPISGGEQMYQALRTLGVDTELVVYPGQYHEFTRPSYLRDRAERFIAWYDRYLKATRE